MSKPHVPKPPYPAQFRQQLVELIQSGRNPNELAREFGCTSLNSGICEDENGNAILLL